LKIKNGGMVAHIEKDGYFTAKRSRLYVTKNDET
jgi:hypothetical protein